MSQKNETTILVLSILITVGLIAGGFWWFTRKSGVDLNTINSGSTKTPQTALEQPSGNTFTLVKDVPTGLFNYGGSTSWAPIRLVVDSAIQAARPELRLRYVEPSSASPGSGTGIQSLIDGQLAFAQSSRPVLDQELSRAQQRGFSLKQIPVAIDGLAVAVNPNLNISGLTVDQLKSIYTGKINNWSQVGGPNILIKPYSRRIADGGTVELFVQDILGGQAFSSNVEFISTTTQALQKLAGSPGSIYYASAPEVIPQCSIKPLPLGRTQGQYIAPYQEPSVLPSECPGKRNKLNIEAFQSGKYPITRNLFVVVKQNGQTEQQAGVAYANLLLTEQGQELITQAGFVKIR
ncbi:PstS family phosphate ABC transporter substrate-binding protein [Nostoc sp. UIC 10607]|uniref:PstS family phosphate ABC transporter substrate-binding protein n=2 Tax=Nostoc TaxID=1177 RepID=A0ABR8IGQ2_9NOSO|nr:MULTISPECIES: PstS family phosphate ABC transporter substrate-binding protein [Nostoc]MBD2565072.1 PstS family phosphate ABC transporter substrate-binding protein [Nostoc linckia FACHB-391]MBD2650677.1 PstS family phosphate ABC transporter substrate-binding protein [Nostoc foliaceum FACHB-393]